MARRTSSSAGLSVGDDLVRTLYSRCALTVTETQPLFVLHRDTIQTFLHEKLGAMQAESRLLAYAGIGLTLLATLLTATFNDFWVFKGSLIQGTFAALSLIIVVLFLREAMAWIRLGRRVNPQSLTEELGARGATIMPMPSASPIPAATPPQS